MEQHDHHTAAAAVDDNKSGDDATKVKSRNSLSLRQHAFSAPLLDDAGGAGAGGGGATDFVTRNRVMTLPLFGPGKLRTVPIEDAGPSILSDPSVALLIRCLRRRVDALVLTGPITVEAAQVFLGTATFVAAALRIVMDGCGVASEQIVRRPGSRPHALMRDPHLPQNVKWEIRLRLQLEHLDSRIARTYRQLGIVPHEVM